MQKTFLALLFVVVSLQAEILKLDKEPLGFVFLDLNNDGKSDAAILSIKDQNNSLLELYYDGKGLQSGSPDLIINIPGGHRLSGLCYEENAYLIISVSKQKVMIYSSTDGFQKQFLSGSANQWSCEQTVGHLTGDGIDILHGGCWRKFLPPDRIRHGYFSGQRQNDNHDSLIADLNCDGNNDLLTTSGKTPEIRLHYAPYMGKMQIKPVELAEYVELLPELIIGNMTVGDINNDERPDLVAATLPSYDTGNRKTYIFLQNQPLGFTSGAKPTYTINGNGIPLILNNTLYLADRSGNIRIFSKGNFDKTDKVIKSGLESICFFSCVDEQLLVTGRKGNRWHIILVNPDATSQTNKLTKQAPSPFPVFPHYTGSVYPTPRQVIYHDSFLALINLNIIPGTGINKNDLRIQFIIEQTEEYGGQCTIYDVPQADSTNLFMLLDDKFHPQTEAYNLKVDPDKKEIYLTGVDRAGLSWATGSFLQLITTRNGKPVVRGVEIVDYPEAKRRGYWAGGLKLDSFTLRDWAKIHMLYKLNTALFIRPHLLAQEKQEGWRVPLSEKRLAAYQEMGNLFNPLGFEWYIGIRPIEGTPQEKINSASEEDFQIMCNQARAVVKYGGCFQFQYDDHRYPRHPDEIIAYPNGGDADFEFISRVIIKVREEYPGARFAFGLPMYWGPNAPPAYPDDRDDYLSRVKKLPEDVLFLWNGPVVCSATVSPEDTTWAKNSYGRKPALLVFNGGTNIHRYHYATDPVYGWKEWYYPGMVEALNGVLLGTNQPGYLLLTMTFADYWWNPEAYEPEQSIRLAFSSLVGNESFSAAQEISQRLQTLNEFGTQVTPHIIRNLKSIRETVRKAREKYDDAAQINPSLARWTSLNSHITTFERLIHRIEKVDNSQFVQEVEKIITFAEKETGYSKNDDILLTAYDFGGGGSAMPYHFRCEQRLATYIRGLRTNIHTMSAAFILPGETLNKEFELVIIGQDDDAEENCRIKLSLNDVVIHEGDSGFDRFGWNIRRFSVPKGILKEGENRIKISNIMDSGIISGPPFFMLNYLVVKSR